MPACRMSATTTWVSTGCAASRCWRWGKADGPVCRIVGLRYASRNMGRGTPMQIVDAQIPTWGTGLPSNLSHRQVTAFTPAEAIALMDEGGVDAAIIHPPGWDPGSTEMAFGAVRDYPGRFAIMGSVPLDRPESRDRIAAWRQQPGMLGVRYTF